MRRHPKKVAVIVHACDRHQLLFKGFEYFFTKYWDFDIECSYYFATEKICADIYGFQNIKSGPGAWSDRLAYLLKEIVTEDYVLYFQEDMWLDKKVDKDFFEYLFGQAIYFNWKQVKLHSAVVYRTHCTGHYVQGFNVSRINKRLSGYLMSHQITLWEKEFLIDQLHENEHQWRNERLGTKRLQVNPTPIYHIDYFAENGTNEINENRLPVRRSRYYSVSMNGLLNMHIESFVCQLMHEGPDEKKYAKRLMRHYHNQMLHNQIDRPVRVAIFKRIKMWILQQVSSSKTKTL